jgi:hypothetical protein
MKRISDGKLGVFCGNGMHPYALGSTAAHSRGTDLPALS